MFICKLIKKRAVVYKEHSLGVIDENGVFHTLHRDVFKSGKAYQSDAPIFPEVCDIRDATEEDFADYRVKFHPSYLVS
jgi:hypothetical protein